MQRICKAIYNRSCEVLHLIRGRNWAKRIFQDGGTEDLEHERKIGDKLIRREDHEDEIKAHEAPKTDYVRRFRHAAESRDIEEGKAGGYIDVFVPRIRGIALEAGDGD